MIGFPALADEEVLSMSLTSSGLPQQAKSNFVPGLVVVNESATQQSYSAVCRWECNIALWRLLPAEPGNTR